MTPQERDLITILLDRLNGTEGHPKDAEATTLIREMAVGWPDVPYSLVQTELIQDLSLHSAQRRITDLETQLTEINRASSAPPSFLGGPSFLGDVFGRDEHSGSVRMRNAPPTDPGTGFPVPATPQPVCPEWGSAARSAPDAALGGSGFLRSAAITAAGIAGGVLPRESSRCSHTKTGSSGGASTDKRASAGAGLDLSGTGTAGELRAIF